MDVAVIGAGGHAKVVISTLQADRHTVRSILDDNPDLWGHSVMGIPVLGAVSLLEDTETTAAIVAIGDNTARQQVVALYKHVNWVTAVHPQAYVHPSVGLGPGTVVMAGAVVQVGVAVGRHCIVNTGATVDHDCTLGDFAHIAPGVHLAGRVHVGTGAMLGISSCAIPGVRVGDWASVGAGGVVIRDIPARCTVVGVPARVLR